MPMLLMTIITKSLLHTANNSKVHFLSATINYNIFNDIIEAHCYFVDIGRIDREQIRSRINNNDCRTFRPRRPLSTAYRTKETAV